MLQVVVSKPAAYKALLRLPKSEKFLRFDLRAFAHLSDEELLGKLYRRVGLHGGITKQTSPNRFAELGPATLAQLQRMEQPHIHDVGVSSGITSVELYELLESNNVAFNLTVSDRYAQFYWQRRGLAQHLYDADGRLQCSYALGIYGDRHTNWKYPLSRLLHGMAPKILEGDAHEFLLYHPQLLKLIEQQTIKHRSYDVLKGEQLNSYQYVRCMNLLNVGYFSEDDLCQGLRVLAWSLTAGGILQLGRTRQDGSNHAGFYQLANGAFELVDRVGEGSEIDSLVRQVALSDPNSEQPQSKRVENL